MKAATEWKDVADEPEAGSNGEPKRPPIPKPVTLRELIAKYPKMRAPNIHGLLREGETCNVISAPKVGKSWMVSGLALCKAAGLPWLGLFDTAPGRVLIIDNELHGETSANRLPKVADAMGIPAADYLDTVEIVNLRGCLQDILGIGEILFRYSPGELAGGLVIVDAYYRTLPRGADENDNSAVASVYNQIDAYALRLGCSFVLVHHSSKGSQTGKAVTDVGSGAGAQSRATDTHLVLRPHQEPGCFVLDAAVRSWPPIEPRVLRWEFPVWHRADDLDPADLKPERPSRRRAKPPVDAEPKEPAEPAWTPERFAEAFIRRDPEHKNVILARAVGAGMTQTAAGKWLRLCIGAELAHEWPTEDRRVRHCATARPPLLGPQ